MKLNSKVYLIYDGQIIQESVYAISSFSFIIDGYEDKLHPEYYFSEKGTLWFSKLCDAKRYLEKKYQGHVKKIEDGLWEI